MEIAAGYDIKDKFEYHDNTGYMQTAYSRWFWPTTSKSRIRNISSHGVLTTSAENIVKATKALGIPIDDQAIGKAIGGYFSPHNLDTKSVTRSSAKEAYYASAVQQPNFYLLAGNQVSRILTSGPKGTVKVTGIEFASSAYSQGQSVKVKHETILAAGSLHS